MKKTLVALALAAALSTAAFANIELSVNGYFPIADLGNVNMYNPNTSDAITEDLSVAGFGIENCFSFFFGSPTSFLDLGLNAEFGCDFTGGSRPCIGVGLFLTAGPSVRFNLGNMVSFLISPGVSLEWRYIASYTNQPYLFNYNALTEAFNLDLGMRLWVVTIPGFSFGFDLGGDLSWPFAKQSYEISYAAEGDTGSTSAPQDLDMFEAKIYIGVVFNFGDRSIQKF